jgi:hypothetical protein
MAYNDDVEELLKSQDELVIVGQVLMGIILDQSLQPLLESKLEEAQIEPGFAQRAMDIQEKFTHDRKRLMARGDIR